MSSGSTDFSVSRDEIIVEAMQYIGALGQEESPSAADISDCSRALNMLVKQHQGSADFAPGMKMWSRKRHVLFMNGSNQLALGGFGDPSAATGLAVSKLTGTEAASQTAIGVVSEANFTVGGSAGVVLDTGAIHWATVINKSAGNVDIAPGIPSQATVGNRVFGYVSKISRPIDVRHVTLREYTDNGGSEYLDILLDPMTEGYFAAIGNKRAVVNPTKWYYEQQLPSGVLFLDSIPDDANKILLIEYVAPIDDFDDLNDTPDYPQEGFLFLSLKLAKLICPKYKMKWTKELEDNMMEATAIFKNLYPETTEEYFQPDL